MRPTTRRPSPPTPSPLDKPMADALGLFSRGQLPEAEQAVKTVLARDPGHRDARHLEAMIVFSRGDMLSADEKLQAVIADHPHHAPLLNDHGMILTRLKRFAKAERALVEAVNAQPSNPGFRLNLAILYNEMDMVTDAEEQLLAAIAARRDYPDVYRLLSELMTKDERPADALKAARLANKLAPDDPRSMVRLVEALNASGEMDEARRVFETALERFPDHLPLRIAYSQFIRGQGAVDESIAILREAVDQSPGPGAPYLILATSTKIEADDPIIEKMEALVADPETADLQRTQLHFALGKVYEDTKQYPLAFDHMLKGNALARTWKRYSKKAALAELESRRMAFSAKALAEGADVGFDDETPIFVLGMPRSGTTLTEQILSTHGTVHGGGELRALGNLVSQMYRKLRARNDAELLARATPDDWRKLGQSYIGRIRKLAPDARYIVDKMPDNYRFIGHIKLALPKAKVIYCKRSAPDNCISIFSIMFQSNRMGYGYNLEELGYQYRLHARLMEHWQSVLPDFVFTNRYEDMIADQENQSRKLLSFAGLDWDPNVLAFFDTKRNVKTASVVQVRQPIYTSSVGRYKRYGPAVQPLLDALDFDESSGEIRT